MDSGLRNLILETKVSMKREKETKNAMSGKVF